MDLENLLACTGFDWDAANIEKNWEKHRVSRVECEQVFINRPLVLAAEEKHPQGELRHYALGQTDKGRRLFIVVTIRGHLLRVISARPLSRSERRRYDQEENSPVPQ